LLVPESRVLFAQTAEHPQVAVISSSFDQEVDVVGHKAVRDDCEAAFSCGAQKLRKHEVDGGAGGERAMAARRAKRQEKAVRTEVVERLQPGTLREHGRAEEQSRCHRRSQACAKGQLKTRATATGGQV
jgi:hypothetical protein